MGSVPPASPLEPGYRLERYELLCKIGQGGMATVWLARVQGKHGFERLVAIKTVLPEHTLEPGFRNALLDESRIASAIDHPNVARIIDVGEDRDVPFLVMEYIGGESLNRLRRTLATQRRLVPPQIALSILADACAGLHAAHELKGPDGSHLGIVHRDVSPQNILVTEAGVTKVIDFGVAKAAGRLQSETATGIIKGKVPYMAPEQAFGTTVVDRRADVWAIGSVAYYLLAGAYPFDGPNDAARLVRVLSGDPPPPLPPEIVPAPIAAVVLRALERNPDRRYQTTDELRAAFEAAMAQSSLAATTDEIARFFAEQLAESAHIRKSTVDRALVAATDRARAREQLEPGPPSSSGDLSGPRLNLEDLSGSTSVGTVGPPVVIQPVLAARSRVGALVGTGVVVVVLVLTAFAIGSFTSSRSRAPLVVVAAPPAPPPSGTVPAAMPISAPEPTPIVSAAAAATTIEPSASASSSKAPTTTRPTTTVKRTTSPVRTNKKSDDDTIF